MRDVKRFPTTTGLSWLEMSSFKDHLFKGHEKIGKEYDYAVSYTHLTLPTKA